MSTQIARRQFLIQAAKSLGVAGVGSMLFDSILGNFFSRAVAQTMGTTLNPSGYYIHLSLPGGPPRWYFDLPLAPTGVTAANFIQGGFGTRIEKIGANWESSYSVDRHIIAGKTIHLPPVWNMPVGGQNFTSLLPHTAFIRGVDMEINNHGLSNGRQTAPIIGGYSISGMVADGSDRPMPGIIDPGASASRAFRSKKRYSPNTVTHSSNLTKNLAGEMLSPFIDFMKGRSVHSARSNALTQQTFAEFEKYAAARGIASSTVTEMYDAGMDLIEKNTYAIASNWDATVAKYRNLISLAVHPTKGQLPGIFDAAVPTDTSGRFRIDATANPNANHSDLRNMVQAATTVPRMAENFAIAELLIDKLTSNLTLAFPALTGLNGGTRGFDMTHDQHNHGSVVSTMGTTLFYRAFLACLTEFTGVLKARGLFDRTVIHISSEFNRTPQANKSGSDHGFMASNTTLISGMIAAPSVIGNIQKASYSTTYTGTFGVARDYNLGGLNRPIQVNDVARTVTAMLGVDDIVTNGRALLAPVGGKWTPIKEEAKNV